MHPLCFLARPLNTIYHECIRTASPTIYLKSKCRLLHSYQGAGAGSAAGWAGLESSRFIRTRRSAPWGHAPAVKKLNRIESSSRVWTGILGYGGLWRLVRQTEGAVKHRLLKQRCADLRCCGPSTAGNPEP